ncbi:MAG: PilZ domain-containing protein [Hyphomicrobium sp.]
MLSRKFSQKSDDHATTLAKARSDASTSVALDRLKRLSVKPAPVAAAIDPAATSAAEGRRAPRKSSVIGGVITSSSMVAERACKIVDMSATGAKIRLMPTSDQTRGLPAGVPDTFTLVLRVDRVEVDCEVAWRHDREFGVKFRGVPRPIAAKGR